MCIVCPNIHYAIFIIVTDMIANASSALNKVEIMFIFDITSVMLP